MFVSWPILIVGGILALIGLIWLICKLPDVVDFVVGIF